MRPKPLGEVTGERAVPPAEKGDRFGEFGEVSPNLELLEKLGLKFFFFSSCFRANAARRALVASSSFSDEVGVRGGLAGVVNRALFLGFLGVFTLSGGGSITTGAGGPCSGTFRL